MYQESLFALGVSEGVKEKEVKKEEKTPKSEFKAEELRELLGRLKEKASCYTNWELSDDDRAEFELKFKEMITSLETLLDKKDEKLFNNTLDRALELLDVYHGIDGLEPSQEEEIKVIEGLIGELNKIFLYKKDNAEEKKEAKEELDDAAKEDKKTFYQDMIEWLEKALTVVNLFEGTTVDSNEEEEEDSEENESTFSEDSEENESKSSAELLEELFTGGKNLLASLNKFSDDKHIKSLIKPIKTIHECLQVISSVPDEVKKNNAAYIKPQIEKNLKDEKQYASKHAYIEKPVNQSNSTPAEKPEEYEKDRIVKIYGQVWTDREGNDIVIKDRKMTLEQIRAEIEKERPEFTKDAADMVYVKIEDPQKPDIVVATISNFKKKG